MMILSSRALGSTQIGIQDKLDSLEKAYMSTIVNTEAINVSQQLHILISGVYFNRTSMIK